MCEVATIMGIMAVAGAAAGAIGQAQQASATQKAAMNNYNLQVKQTQLQQQQVNAQASQQERQRAMQAQAAEARMMVASGESGVSGVTVDRNFAEIAGNANQDISTMEANRQMKMQQSSMDGMGLQSNAQGIINTNRGPGALAAGLQIAGAGVRGYTAAGGKFGQ